VNTTTDVRSSGIGARTAFDGVPRSSAAPRSSHHASVVNVASVSITIDGSGDPKATGAAVASALHPMSLLRTAGVNRSTPSLPFAFGMNGVK
jgi:hypothetical protein